MIYSLHSPYEEASNSLLRCLLGNSLIYCDKPDT